MASLGHGRFPFSGDSTRLPIVWCSSGGMEESCFLSQVSSENRDSRDGLWVRMPGKPHHRLRFGPKGMAGPKFGFLVQLPRGLV